MCNPLCSHLGALCYSWTCVQQICFPNAESFLFSHHRICNEERAVFMCAHNYNSVIAVPMKLIVSVLCYVESEKCPSKLVHIIKAKLLSKLQLWALSILMIPYPWFGFFSPRLRACSEAPHGQKIFNSDATNPAPASHD